MYKEIKLVSYILYDISCLSVKISSKKIIYELYELVFLFFIL